MLRILAIHSPYITYRSPRLSSSAFMRRARAFEIAELALAAATGQVVVAALQQQLAGA